MSGAMIYALTTPHGQIRGEDSRIHQPGMSSIRSPPWSCEMTRQGRERWRGTDECRVGHVDVPAWVSIGNSRTGGLQLLRKMQEQVGDIPRR